MLGFIGSILPILIVIIGVLFILSVILRMWKKVPQDKAGVVVGLKKRVITGGGGLVIPVLEEIKFISLGNQALKVITQGSLSSQGVPINVIATAIIKVKNTENDILTAMEQFAGRSEQETVISIKNTSEAILEGKLREIIASMTVEELYQNRDSFCSTVSEVVSKELATMGLEARITITDIADEQGYIKALGLGALAEKKKDAAVRQAIATRDQTIETAKAEKEGRQAQLDAEAQIAQADKDKEVKLADYRKEQDTARAISELAHDIQSNITQKDVIAAQMDAQLLAQNRQREITEAQIQVQIVAEQKNIELAEKKAEQTKKALLSTVVEPANAEKLRAMATADANKYAFIADAQAKAEAKKVDADAEATAKKLNAEAESNAVLVKAQAESEATRLNGQAEADAIKAKGLAEAEAMEKKAVAMGKYGQAAMMEMLINILPDMAREVSKSVESIDKITIIDGGSDGNGVNQVGGYVPSVLAKTIESLKETVGFDLTEVMKANTLEAKTDRNITINGVDELVDALDGDLKK